MLNLLIRFVLHNKLITFAVFGIIIFIGIYTAPFDWHLGFQREPVPVDAIPDIGENQQIVFTSWNGRSPKDIEDQITYPLISNLLGVPGVKTVRGSSMFGFSMIYVIFKDNIDFYWSRSRILEKLSSLPPNTLPEGVSPRLGPDATALGQIFLYTLEGRDSKGNPTGGWDLQELRSIQDWIARYSLLGIEGVSEVSSVGGFIKEYQIELNPNAMKASNVSLNDIFNAVKESNIDIGANTLALNGIEYFVRGLGYLKSIVDVENSVIKSVGNTPIYIKNVANVSLGPQYRRGILNKRGSDAVGGVVTVRYGENPLEVINRVKDKLNEISASLPNKTLKNGVTSQVTVVPFYDRTTLIQETLGTLNSALIEEILITIIVILLMIRQFKVAGLIASLLPSSVLFAFVLMKFFKIDANIVALSGIAIAIGTVVDMGIVMCENIVKHMNESPPEKGALCIIYDASSEVAGSLLTSTLTTVVSFTPVFMLQYSEGKLFRPLAFTKTFTIGASLVIALLIIPPAAYFLFKNRNNLKKNKIFPAIFSAVIAILSIFVWEYTSLLSILLIILAAYNVFLLFQNQFRRKKLYPFLYFLVPAIVIVLLAVYWRPIGYENNIFYNILFVVIPICGFLIFYSLFYFFYKKILTLCLNHKKVFLAIPVCLLLFGIISWRGLKPVMEMLPQNIQKSDIVQNLNNTFSGLGQEFMPSLNEGSFLLMPSIMPNASIDEVNDILSKQNIRIASIPEVSEVVGKAGRADSALDPAPLSMIETIINYYPEYISDSSGRYLRFKYNYEENDYFRNEKGEKINAPDGKSYIVKGKFYRDSSNNLIPDSGGNVFRLWRPALQSDLNYERTPWQGINNPDDIWNEIVVAAKIPGVTSSPKLQPIETRIVMLQSGMRANMGVIIKGKTMEDVEVAAEGIEKALKNVPSIESATVFAPRVTGKPYIEIEINRTEAARYGVTVQSALKTIEASLGGMVVTSTVEGRERYPVRIRYMREYRDDPDSIRKILIASTMGQFIPLGQIADIQFFKGPQNITSEDGFLVNYVFFDKKSNVSEMSAVEEAQKTISHYIDAGEIKMSPGTTYRFGGSYENSIRASKKLMVVIPLVLLCIILIIYMQFKSFGTTFIIGSGIVVTWAGGFIMLWLYGQSWFMDFNVLGTNFRDLFQMHTLNLSVAVWVGFLALFGIATDDGVLMSSYIKDIFNRKKPNSKSDVKSNILQAAHRRCRAALMTTATTVLALIPILTSTGKGSDIMIPMAVPIFGGMIIEIITMLIVPVLYCIKEEIKLKKEAEM